jgi:hypothetical protein
MFEDRCVEIKVPPVAIDLGGQRRNMVGDLRPVAERTPR